MGNTSRTKSTLLFHFISFIHFKLIDMSTIEYEHPDYKALAATHPARDECPDAECVTCGWRDCPEGEPLHHDKDGCPVCVFMHPLPIAHVDSRLETIKN